MGFLYILFDLLFFSYINEYVIVLHQTCMKAIILISQYIIPICSCAYSIFGKVHLFPRTLFRFWPTLDYWENSFLCEDEDHVRIVLVYSKF